MHIKNYSRSYSEINKLAKKKKLNISKLYEFYLIWSHYMSGKFHKGVDKNIYIIYKDIYIKNES